MQNLRISLVQADLVWHQADVNRLQFEALLAPLAGQTDLVVLPEMFTTGFTMSPETVAEPENGDTVQWMQAQAAQLNAALVGSVVTQTADGYRNRLLFCTPEGEVTQYDKRHLFRMGGEHNHYQAGSERVVLTYRGWRIMPQICYDLRFPVFSRNRNEYDLLLYVANWPAPRRHAWRTLLQARAIENQSYVAGVNRVGADGAGLQYSGDSLLADFCGELLIDNAQGEAFVATHLLDAGALAEYRQRFPAWMDADAFELKL